MVHFLFTFITKSESISEIYGFYLQLFVRFKKNTAKNLKTKLNKKNYELSGLIDFRLRPAHLLLQHL